MVALINPGLDSINISYQPPPLHCIVLGVSFNVVLGGGQKHLNIAVLKYV
jgi:hypothetical protein